MVFHDFFANGQPYAGAGVFSAGVEPLEHLKDALGILRLNADPVILNGKSPLISIRFGSDADFRPALVAIFDRIANEILEQLGELSGIAEYCR